MGQNFNANRRSSLLVIFVCLAALQLSAQPSTLPPAVVSAHTIFIENETGFPELQYTVILELSKWGRFELAESRGKADLVLRLDSGSSVRPLPEGQEPATGVNAFPESPVPKGHTRIALIDPKTGATLWSDVHKTEGRKVKSGHLLDGLREAFDEYEKNRNHS
jgi:hypothetical protein